MKNTSQKARITRKTKQAQRMTIASIPFRLLVVVLLLAVCTMIGHSVTGSPVVIAENTTNNDTNYTIHYDSTTSFIEINPDFAVTTRNRNATSRKKKKHQRHPNTTKQGHSSSSSSSTIHKRRSSTTTKIKSHPNETVEKKKAFNDDNGEESDEDESDRSESDDSVSSSNYKSIAKKKSHDSIHLWKTQSQQELQKIWIGIKKHRIALLSACLILACVDVLRKSGLFGLANVWKLLLPFLYLVRLGVFPPCSIDEDHPTSSSIHWMMIGNNHIKNAYNPPIQQHFMFEKINDRYVKDSIAIGKKLSTSTTATTKKTNNETSSKIVDLSSSATTTVMEKVAVVMEVKVDATFSQLEEFRDAISFLLTTFQTNPLFQGRQVEIILVLESSGGLVSAYGLAAYELSRIRNESNETNPITLTVCVDKVAASGGYMLACQATKGNLFTTPFALLGSIGVIGQTINVHNVLQSFGVRPLVFKSGEQKSPLGMIGEVTQEGMAKVQQNLDNVHDAFKTLVIHSRQDATNLDVDKISTGDVWLGKEAVDIGLADKILSSQEYIAAKILNGDTVVLKLKSYQREPTFAGFLRPRSFPFGTKTKLLMTLVEDAKRLVEMACYHTPFAIARLNDFKQSHIG